LCKIRTAEQIFYSFTPGCHSLAPADNKEPRSCCLVSPPPTGRGGELEGKGNTYGLG